MEPIEYEFRMQENIKGVLFKLVDASKKSGVYTGFYQQSNIGGHYSLGDEQIIDDSNIAVGVFRRLKIISFLETGAQKGWTWFQLEDTAFKYASYYRKPKFIQFIVRLPTIIRDIAIVISFILSVSLTIIQIFHLVK
jgi:hypothetical protein